MLAACTNWARDAGMAYVIIIIEKSPLHTGYPRKDDRCYYSHIYGSFVHRTHATRYKNFEAAEPTLAWLREIHEAHVVSAIEEPKF
jgi:hypothetical protein